ncbi:MAG: L,D-transpeptidase [Anaerolineales bacterium]|nr:L,D-transpeptidase [Anaerolineales bacterium]
MTASVSEYPNHRRQLFLAFAVILAAALALLVAGPAQASGEGEPADGDALCMPEVYAEMAAGCSMLGPAAYIDRVTRMGVELPARPVPASAPSADLVQLDYRYAQVMSPNAPMYATLDDASGGGKPASRLESGFDFVSYQEMVEVSGHRYFLLRSGEWMYGGDLSRIGAVSPFQGLLIHAPLDRPFGWILQPTESKRSPGYENQADYTGHSLNRYDQVQVYGSQEVNDIKWLLIGPDEWIEERFAGVVYSNPTPPEGVTNGRWIEVNLYEQTIMVYEDSRLIYATMMSSGLPGFWTRPGLFQIETKLESTPMRGAFEADRSDFYFLQDVPWTMYFDESRAFHGAYWHNGYGYPRSHGCVNLSPGDARWLFDWADEGDWVYVWDPSGNTPVDPDAYGAGGA